MKISSFRGKHAFLSNFYPGKILFERQVYPTVEHAYQAAKTLKEGERYRIRNARTPGEAKALGKKITLRKDWDQKKLEVMLFLLRAKFSNPRLRRALLGTGNLDIVEENLWGDGFWGVDIRTGQGENWLGRLLMQVRAEARDRADKIAQEKGLVPPISTWTDQRGRE